MKAVSQLRTRMRMNTNDEPAQARRRARTSGSEAFAFLSPPLTDTGLQRAWAVCPRKLRGLHPSPVIIYVRENPTVLSTVMDSLYGTLVSTYGVDSRDIRVTDVPTAYDVPSAVRRMGKGKQLVVVVALLTRDKLWFDEAQVSRVREFLLTWSQQNAVPLVDGIQVADEQDELQQKVCAPQWNIKAPERATTFEESPTDDVAPVETPSTSDEYTFGQYLAHRAIEMFYFEHRGW
ncbi:hypothetical protein GGH12_003975 [Coemansia sp. RSA 1822]|nr:hypothetical protein LPJ76_003660 [Coemansia sp. RSA 638]KAJ2120267.1 hypothetical protein IW147_005233 [Coemansia sp. RSA 720]KAJ2561445.1 hypothetical protein GGH12_003975 [Coemansia sp. RSA 1822]KAJ2658066.1 hypothetical protein IW148_004855 [Coemansia sp. RSA 1199]